MKLSTLTICLLMSILFPSCSNKKAEKIQIQIPTELAQNEEVKSYLDRRISTTETYIRIMEDAIEIAGEEGSVENAEELSAIQMLKLGKIAIQMNSKATELKDLQKQQATIKNKIPEKDTAAFTSVCQQIDQHLDKHKVAGMELEQAHDQVAHKREKTEAQIAWEEAQKELPPEQRLENQQTQNDGDGSQGFGLIDVLFPLLVLGGIITSIVFGIKKLRSRVRDISYSMSEVGSKAKSILNAPKAVTGKDGELKDEERKSLEQLVDYLDNKQ